MTTLNGKRPEQSEIEADVLGVDGHVLMPFLFCTVPSTALCH